MKLLGTPAEVILAYGGIVDANPHDDRAGVSVYLDGSEVIIALRLDHSWGARSTARERFPYDDVDGKRRMPAERIATVLRTWAAEHGPLFVKGLHGRAGARMVAAGQAVDEVIDDA